LVTLRRDGEDFVVAFYPEDIVVFRNPDPQALRKNFGGKSLAIQRPQTMKFIGTRDDLRRPPAKCSSLRPICRQ
jgi:hypothetical protein